jgi:hypothetical protein
VIAAMIFLARVQSPLVVLGQLLQKSAKG